MTKIESQLLSISRALEFCNGKFCQSCSGADACSQIFNNELNTEILNLVMKCTIFNYERRKNE